MFVPSPSTIMATWELAWEWSESFLVVVEQREQWEQCMEPNQPNMEWWSPRQQPWLAIITYVVRCHLLGLMLSLCLCYVTPTGQPPLQRNKNWHRLISTDITHPQPLLTSLPSKVLQAHAFKSLLQHLQSILISVDHNGQPRTMFPPTLLRSRVVV